jgi:hypothetical protein
MGSLVSRADKALQGRKIAMCVRQTCRRLPASASALPQAYLARAWACSAQLLGDTERLRSGAGARGVWQAAHAAWREAEGCCVIGAEHMVRGQCKRKAHDARRTGPRAKQRIPSSQPCARGCAAWRVFAVCGHLCIVVCEATIGGEFTATVRQGTALNRWGLHLPCRSSERHDGFQGNRPCPAHCVDGLP